MAPERDLHVTWRPISLFLKNDPAPDSPYYGPTVKTHKMLRVMEAVRAGEGSDVLQRLYFELGSRIHHDKDLDFPMADALRAAGLDPQYADALEDETWEAAVVAGHEDGLSLVGNDVGTPIIAIADADGERVGLFGPVITRVPPKELSLQLWDGLLACMQVPGFWELKRTRTEGPDVGDRPALG